MYKKIIEKFEDISLSRNVGVDLQRPFQVPSKGIGIDLKTIYRNRFNYGVNLGGLFVLEQWIYHYVFREGGDSEFDAVSNLVKKYSSNEAIKVLTEHYQKYLDQIDWEWLKNEAGITALRVPIGYWHVGNAKYVKSTPFESLQSVYSKANPWETLKSLIEKASEWNIGILIDLHGLPGGANNDSHSGKVHGSAKFFEHSKYIDLVAQEIIPFIVKDVSGYDNIIGLQIINESIFSDKAKHQKQYYTKAIKSVNQLDPKLPVVISDGWWPEQWADWLTENKLDEYIVVDSHIYRCFSDSDKSKHAGQIIDELQTTVNFPKDKADFMVGEFSGVLDGSTWAKTQGDRNVHVQNFVSKECEIFSQRASYGWFFWTLQFQSGDGGEWGLKPMTENGGIPKRKTKAIPSNITPETINAIITEHVSYWDQNGNGDKFEHEKFKDGLYAALDDIKQFREFDNSLVGRWHALRKIRMAEYLASHPNTNTQFMWEWEQGYERALHDFNHY